MRSVVNTVQIPVLYRSPKVGSFYQMGLKGLSRTVPPGWAPSAAEEGGWGHRSRLSFSIWLYESTSTTIKCSTCTTIILTIRSFFTLEGNKTLSGKTTLLRDTRKNDNNNVP